MSAAVDPPVPPSATAPVADPPVAAPPVASRLPDAGTTIFTVMSQLALEHRAVNLGQGFPDFEPPARLRELVAVHANGGRNQYAPMAGAMPLREAIAAKLVRHYGRHASPAAEITVTCGGTEALACAIQAVVHPGDEVVVFDPAYDSYEPIATLCGARTRHVPLRRPDFALDLDALAAALTPRTRLVVVNTPHNPSGACASPAELDALAALLRPTGAFVLADEVYEHMVFDGARHASLNAHPELAARAFVVSSFGKTYHATGWKIGYCVAPPALTAEFRKVHQYVTFAIATPLQHAIADFMTEHPEWEHELPAFYAARRDRLGALLAGSRFRFTPARSTYFQLVDYSAIADEPDAAFAQWLLREHGVASIPVSLFCAAPPPDERLVRLCFAKDDATLEAACARLRSV
jgi:methionine aminotransferase